MPAGLRPPFHTGRRALNTMAHTTPKHRARPHANRMPPCPHSAGVVGEVWLSHAGSGGRARHQRASHAHLWSARVPCGPSSGRRTPPYTHTCVPGPACAIRRHAGPGTRMRSQRNSQPHLTMHRRERHRSLASRRMIEISPASSPASDFQLDLPEWAAAWSSLNMFRCGRGSLCKGGCP